MASGYPDYEGGKRKVYLVPAWAAEEGLDKNVVGTSALTASGFMATTAQYTVPAGKTLYITDAGLGVTGGVVAEVQWYIYFDETIKTINGGVQGSIVAFTKPLVATAGTVVSVRGKHVSADNQFLMGYLGGYEV